MRPMTIYCGLYLNNFVLLTLYPKIHCLIISTWQLCMFYTQLQHIFAKIHLFQQKLFIFLQSFFTLNKKQSYLVTIWLFYKTITIILHFDNKTSQFNICFYTTYILIKSSYHKCWSPQRNALPTNIMPNKIYTELSNWCNWLKKITPQHIWQVSTVWQ